MYRDYTHESILTTESTEINLQDFPDLPDSPKSTYSPWKAFGQLVRLGFDVTVFTPAAYQRRGLRRP